MIFAIASFAIGAAALLWVEDRLLQTVRGVPVTEWLAEHVYVPLLRAFLLLMFVALAHPELYGLSEAPSLPALVAGSGRLDSVLNGVLLVTLLLPLVPGAQRVPGLIVTAQGLVASSIVFAWLGEAREVDGIRYWQGWAVAARVAAAVLAGYALGWLARRVAAERFDRAHPGLLMEGGRLAAQLPAVIIYARALGAQL